MRQQSFTLRLVLAGFSAAVLVCWALPRFWYVRHDTMDHALWLHERTNVAGWQYRDVPVSEAAERTLVADRLVSGEFTGGGQTVRVFSAKRYTEKQNDIGLFVHTPDRCWTQAGWKIELSSPEYTQLSFFGKKVLFERRVFVSGAQRELVYFGGLVAGESLPYRLDHNLSVGVRQAARGQGDAAGFSLRASDSRLWRRVWDSFVSRRPLLGPKQFIRLSTSLRTSNLDEADTLLAEFLTRWLEPTNYQAEYRSWQQSAPSARTATPARSSTP